MPDTETQRTTIAEEEQEMETDGRAAEEAAAAAAKEGGDGQGSPEQKPFARGLYGKINISVKTLDRIIAVLIILLVAAIVIAVSDRGFTVEFDTLGGTSVESQTLMYGDSVEEPEDPTREGYVFTGWYQDKNCTYEWDMETNTVSESMTLYAGWAEE